MRSFFLAIGVVALLGGCSKPLSTPELLERAEQALQSGDLRAAEVDIKTVLQSDAENATARFLYGSLYSRRMDATSAVVEFERSLQSQPSPETLITLARAQLQAGQTDDFLAAYDSGKYASIDDGYALATVLARAHAAKNDYELARSWMTQAEDRFSAQASDADPIGARYLGLSRAMFQGLIDKDIESAEKTVNEVLEEAPDYADAWSLLGLLASTDERMEDAANSYAKAAELNPRRVNDRVNYVNASLRTGDVESARTELTNLQKILPKSPAVNYLRGQLAFGEGDYKTAIDTLSRVLTAVPDNPDALLLSGSANAREGNLATARRQLTQFLTQQPDHLEANQQLASVWWKMGNADKTEEVARRILKEHEMNAPALSLLALALSAQGLHAESADVYDQLALLNPESSEALVAMGSQKLLAGDQSAALADLREAVELAPDSPQARERLISALVTVDQIDEAWEAAQAYIKSHPDLETPYIAAGKLAFKRQDVDTARQYFERALEIDPGNAQANEGIASLALVNRDFAGARAALDNALAANPGDLMTSLSLAALNEREGDKAAMVSVLEDAMEANPGAVEPRLALARNAVNERRFQDAVEMLSDVREANNSNSVLHEILATAYMALRQTEGALESARKLVELSPDDPGALGLSARIQLLAGRPEVAESQAREALELRADDLLMQRLLIASLVAQDKRFAAKTEIEALPESIREEPAMKVMSGRIALADGDLEAAEDLLESGFEGQRNSVNLLLLTTARWEAGKRDTVFDDYREWLKEYPQDAVVRNAFAARALDIGEDAIAVEQYSAILDQYPGNITALNNLAWLLRESDSDRALELIEEAGEKAPQSHQVKDTHAMVLLARQQYSQALRLNEQALRAAPNDQDIRYHRAEILVAAGRESEAAALLRELVAAPAFDAQSKAKSLLETLSS